MRAIVLLLCSLAILSATPTAIGQDVVLRGPKGVDYGEQKRKYGPINSSHSLWAIAQKFRPNSTVTMYQVMVAFYEKNPQAFLDKNLNHLKDGEYLAIPSLKEIQQIDPYDAKRKADADEKLWAKIRRGEVSENEIDLVAKQIENAKRTDLNQAKEELKQEINSLREKQDGQLGELLKEVGQSQAHVASVLQENQNLNTRIERLSEEISVMKEQLGKEHGIQQQMEELLAQQNKMLDFQQQQVQKAQQQDESLFGEEGIWQTVASNPIFLAGAATIPAILVFGGYWMLRRRKQKPANEEPVLPADSFAAPVDTPTPAPTDSLDDEELTLGDDLFNDHDDDMSDLGFDDDLDLTSDGSVQLDDDDDFNDDIVRLDDDDSLFGDDSSNIQSDGEMLLDTDELDSLLNDVDDAIEEPSSGSTDFDPNAVLSADDLDALLGDLGGDLEEDDAPEPVEEQAAPAEVNPDAILDASDIDDLLDEFNGDAEDEGEDLPEPSPTPATMDEIDDLDQFLDSELSKSDYGNDQPDGDELDGDEFSIDELLEGEEFDLPDTDGANAIDDDELEDIELDIPEELENQTTEIETPANSAGIDDVDSLMEELSESEDSDDGSDDLIDVDAILQENAGEEADIDDIDALLDAAAGDSEAATGEPELSAEPDIDDIDALLDAAAGDSEAATGEPELSAEPDIDDIDALLDAAAGDSEAAIEEPEQSAEPDIDDIDALLDASADDSDVAIEEPELSAEADIDDIDALLDAAADDSEAAIEDPELSVESDIDDIDALLDAAADDSEAASEEPELSVEPDIDDIDALLDAAADDSEAAIEETELSAEPDELTSESEIEASSAFDPDEAFDQQLSELEQLQETDFNELESMQDEPEIEVTSESLPESAEQDPQETENEPALVEDAPEEEIADITDISDLDGTEESAMLSEDDIAVETPSESLESYPELEGFDEQEPVDMDMDDDDDWPEDENESLDEDEEVMPDLADEEGSEEEAPAPNVIASRELEEYPELDFDENLAVQDDEDNQDDWEEDDLADIHIDENVTPVSDWQMEDSAEELLATALEEAAADSDQQSIDDSVLDDLDVEDFDADSLQDLADFSEEDDSLANLTAEEALAALGDVDDGIDAGEQADAELEASLNELESSEFDAMLADLETVGTDADATESLLTESLPQDDEDSALADAFEEAFSTTDDELDEQADADDFVDIETLLQESDDSNDEPYEKIDLSQTLKTARSDTTTSEPEEPEENEAAASQLDLARAYVEMDDPQSAISTLEKLLETATGNIKVQAEALLSDLQ